MNNAAHCLPPLHCTAILSPTREPPVDLPINKVARVTLAEPLLELPQGLT